METSEMAMQAEEAKGNWKDNIPEQLRDAPYFKSADSVDQVLADLSNAAAWQGNSLRMPGPDAGADDMTAFQSKVMEKIPNLMVTPNTEDADSMAATFAKLGRPAAADAYKTPNDIAIDGNEVGQLKALALKANMTQAQFADYMTNLNSVRKDANDSAQLKHEEAISALKGEQGAAWDSFHNAVGNFLKTNNQTPPELVTAYEKGQMPAHMMRYLHTLSQLSAEGSQFEQQMDGGSEVMPVAEAMEQLAEVENRLFSKTDPVPPSDPRYRTLVDKRTKLMLLAYPDADTDLDRLRA